MLTDYILIILLLYWGNTTPETEKTHHEPPVNAQAIVEEIDYCTLDVVTCGEWQEGEFTAYSSGDGFTPSETMASGKRVYEGAIACPNEYKFGDKIEIEGMGTYTCEDRMAKRYRDKKNFDIYLSDISRAQKFGRQKLNFKIIE
jgi:3D (Asp-Asp-Asp) domain-containing protein